MIASGLGFVSEPSSTGRRVQRLDQTLLRRPGEIGTQASPLSPGVIDIQPVRCRLEEHLKRLAIVAAQRSEQSRCNGLQMEGAEAFGMRSVPGLQQTDDR